MLTRDADIAARYGGEEFIVLTHVTDNDHAGLLAERLRSSISESGVTISCGLAHYANEKSRFPDDLIRLSDQAPYEAKKSGENQIVCWNEYMMETNNGT